MSESAELTRPTGAVPAALPGTPRLELATAVDRPPEGEDWLHEIKFDGYRLAATVERGTARLTTRNLLDWTHRFPAIAAAVARLQTATAVLDGEVVALRADGRADFGALQRWLGVLVDGRDSTRGVRVVYQAFDLLYWEGLDLREAPLEERKRALQALLAAPRPGSEDGLLRFTEHLEVAGDDVYQVACRLGLEGIVSKRLGSAYRPGRQTDWLKTACLAGGDFVIGGFTEPTGSRQGLGALLLGEPDDDGLLRYVGKVGTGLDQQLLVSLTRRLRAFQRRGSPFADKVPRDAVRTGVTWVEPRQVVEVAYTDRTGDGRLRHPRFRALREDKAVSDVSAATQQVVPARSAAARAAAQDAGRASRPGGRRNAAAGRQGAAKEARMQKPDTLSQPTSAGGARVAGVLLSNPDRVLYPDQGVTKRDLAEYYADVGEELLRYARGRPLSLVRCPDGSEQQCFYQKHPGAAFAESLPRVPIEESEGVQDYLYLEDVADVVALVQAGVLEIHAWGSAVADLERPDQLVFDLDPSPEVAFDRTKDVARRLRDLLGRLGLTGFLRTTGGKGLHVVVPLTPDSDWDTAKAFARGVAEALAASQPELLTTNMSKAKRAGKLFIDYLRNARGATAITNYSSRSRLGAPVAVPLRWDELGRLKASSAYDITTVRRRLASLRQDPWSGFDDARRPLSAVLAPPEPA